MRNAANEPPTCTKLPVMYAYWTKTFWGDSLKTLTLAEPWTALTLAKALMSAVGTPMTLLACQ